jgi:hypothetical protein
MRSPVAETVDPFQLLDSYLAQWLEAVGELRRLGRKQLQEIVEPTDDRLLSDILAQKEQVYLAANELSLQVSAIKEQISRLKADEGNRDRLRRWEAKEEAIYEGLKDLSEIESQSQEQLKERLQSARLLLENLSQGRKITHAYGHGTTAPPRFLDQKR